MSENELSTKGKVSVRASLVGKTATAINKTPKIEKFNPTKFFKVKEDYTDNEKDELKLRVGDIVEVIYFPHIFLCAYITKPNLPLGI